MTATESVGPSTELAELHVHLGGSIDPSVMWEIATPRGPSSRRRTAGGSWTWRQFPLRNGVLTRERVLEANRDAFRASFVK
ncbi:MAG: hypothetical protein JRN21_03110 [Nitrososphaerota archaeon]|nr:hypothetical protein [Nitrososphaerota archaeon]